jgi:hypothetical protein
MGKTLGDYNIEKSSSSDIKNIKWTQKNSGGTDKLKNKRKKSRKTSPLNIIYPLKTKKAKKPVEKVFKVEDGIATKKPKNKTKKLNKKFRNSSASNCKIEKGFTRSAR